MEHLFTNNITVILEKNFGNDALPIFERSELLQYINQKTKSANKGSKSRGSFANLYAIYVLIEDYLAKYFDERGDYSSYAGAEYSKLLARQRELPFGTKLQNHALNSRMKEEFKKFFPSSKFEPILRDLNSNRYWINENLLKIEVNKQEFNISKSIVEIIDDYIASKQNALQKFIAVCEELQYIEQEKPEKLKNLFFHYLHQMPMQGFLKL